MKKKILVLLFSGALFYTPSLTAQDKSISSAIPLKPESVFMKLEDRQLDKTYIDQNLQTLLGLSDKHRFTKLTETTDNLGFTHIGYQQSFRGIKVDNGMILVHFKNGIVNSISGRIAQIGVIDTVATIDMKSALAAAKSDLGIVREICRYPAELLIVNVGSSKTPEYKLTYKVRVDGKTAAGKVVMMNVFVDAQTGKVSKKVSLIATADVNATAQTLYSGTQTIVTDDSIPGRYRLKDNARKITTYDVTGSDLYEDSNGKKLFRDAKDITNNTATWAEKPALTTITLNTVGDENFVDLAPSLELYLAAVVVKDTGNSQADMQYKSWPAINRNVSSVSDLPASCKNLYVFPDGDTSYIGGLGHFNLIGAMMEGAFFPNIFSYFRISNIGVGLHSWGDGQGNSGTYEIEATRNPALDAHWGTERTYDFYMQVFNRNSYDDKGGEVSNYINGTFPTMFTQNNAESGPPPYPYIVYGIGDGEMADAVVALDVVGHEFTHKVTATNGHGGLDYGDESGALNESFSDIFGTCIEFFAKGNTANWLCGEDCALPAMGGYFRSMSNPKSAIQKPQPDTYEGQYWDLGDPHFSSSVQNKWFYLLTEGGTGTNDKGDHYHVYGIGINQAQQIAYRNLTQYLTPSATFMDAYNGSIQAAIDLYGSNSNAYHSVRNAWYAVGIGEADNALPDYKDVDGSHLKIYPNPATGTLTIASDIDRNIDAQIISLTGAAIMNIKVHKGNNIIDVNLLAKSLYFIRYDNGKRGYAQKFSVY
jgi:Zn-dependent metalloprotease